MGNYVMRHCFLGNSFHVFATECFWLWCGWLQLMSSHRSIINIPLINRKHDPSSQLLFYVPEINQTLTWFVECILVFCRVADIDVLVCQQGSSSHSHCWSLSLFLMKLTNEMFKLKVPPNLRYGHHRFCYITSDPFGQILSPINPFSSTTL